MKTIISSILIIAGTICLHSCRDQGEEQADYIQKQSVDGAEMRAAKDIDTIGTNIYSEWLSDPHEFDDDTSISDPPPKEGGQWKSSY